MQERSIPVDAGDDVRELAVLEAGAGGRPFLLVHGFTGAKEDFADHLDDLADRGWWVVAPDLRGHGASPHPADEAAYSLQRHADDVLALVDALGWDELVLLGHSMGGMVSQVVAMVASNRLRGLVLMDTVHGPVEDIDPDLVAFGAALAREGGMAAVREALDALGEDAPLDTPAHLRLLGERPGYQEFGDRKFLGSSPVMYAATLVEMIGQADRLERLAELDLPTLVLVGDQDARFLGPSKRMADTIRDAELVVIPDAGHSPQFEQPETWMAALIAFLDRVG